MNTSHVRPAVIVLSLAAAMAVFFFISSQKHFRYTPQANLSTDSPTLASFRSGFHTTLNRQFRDGTSIDQPPPGVLQIVQYVSAVGPLGAYLTPDPGDQKRHPAIVWITGGDCNTIGDVWSPAGPENDQTAGAFRDAGIVTMYPSLRGGNQNPGVEEGFDGEVDDVIAAADYLSRQPYVDPSRIYLGGHSSGGTMALLAAESTDRFRAVFAFGPISNIKSYRNSQIKLSFDLDDLNEVSVRSPGKWLWCIKSPTFVFEGSGNPSNKAALQVLQQEKNTTSAAHFFLVPGATHFTILRPTNRLIAQKILNDDAPSSNISFSDTEIASLGR